MTTAEPLWLRDPVTANVRAELARKGVSVNQLQHRIGRTQTYWWRRTNGQVEFSHTDLIEIANLLKINAGEFFTGTEGWAHWDLNPEPAGSPSNLVTGLFLQADELAHVPDREHPAEVIDLAAHRRPVPTSEAGAR